LSGFDDAVVISTGDGVLVTTRSKAENVKALVRSASRRRTGRRRSSIGAATGPGLLPACRCRRRYQVKRIVVKSGGRLSLQKHLHRAEHWIVVRGTAEVTIDADVRTIHENESTYIRSAPPTASPTPARSRWS